MGSMVIFFNFSNTLGSTGCHQVGNRGISLSILLLLRLFTICDFSFFSLFYAETSFVILLKIKTLVSLASETFCVAMIVGVTMLFRVFKNYEKGIIIAINERLGNGLE